MATSARRDAIAGRRARGTRTRRRASRPAGSRRRPPCCPSTLAEPTWRTRDSPRRSGRTPGAMPRGSAARRVEIEAAAQSGTTAADRDAGEQAPVQERRSVGSSTAAGSSIAASTASRITAECERVHEPGGAEQQGEPHEAPRLEQEEGRTHAEADPAYGAQAPERRPPARRTGEQRDARGSAPASRRSGRGIGPFPQVDERMVVARPAATTSPSVHHRSLQEHRGRSSVRRHQHRVRTATRSSVGCSSICRPVHRRTSPWSVPPRRSSSHRSR